MLYMCVDVVVQNLRDEKIAYPRRERILTTLRSQGIQLSQEEELNLFTLLEIEGTIVARGGGRYRFYEVSHTEYMSTRKKSTYRPRLQCHQGRRKHLTIICITRLANAIMKQA